MGDIILDGKKLEESVTAPTLLELVASVEEKFISKEYIITAVAVNGEYITDFTQEDGSLISFDEADDLSIETKKMTELIISSTEEFEKYLDRLIPGVKEIADLFIAGEEAEANKMYLEVIDGIRVMIELIQGLNATEALDFSNWKYEGKTLMELTDSLRKTVEKLVVAQTDGDNSRIAEILHNDFTDELNLWKKVMPSLRENIG